ncbi:MAG: tetraacyldisaccharide 4'-kinase [Cyclobacteriaceae bacterium]|nr:tetraacyldisaccharide 4'-kinase [Cyclobacteriaceae bacterium]
MKLFFTLLLWPFSVIWDGITRLRNYSYDSGWKPAVSFDIPVIVIGNLTVGGTGKTPMTEYIIRLLFPHIRISVLSRGYGRKTRGLHFAGDASTAAEIGDEPMQIHRKFPDVPVVVCEDRVFAIPHILQRYDDIQAVILDDAYQHRRLRPGFSILLTDYSRPFYRDYLMPSGRLRESRKGASRAHVVVVTKCPDNLDEKNMNQIRELVQQYTRAPVYFTSLQYDEPYPLHATKSCLNNKVVLVTGVARPEPLEQWVRNRFTLLRHFRYRDHHHYSVDDLLRIKKFTEQFAEPVSVITTEKDAVKLTALPGYEALSLFAVPVTVRFLNNGKEFDNLVLNYALGRAS